MSSPRVFRHSNRGIVCAVHGGDFASIGACGEFEQVEREMRKKYRLTVGAVLGPGPENDKEGMTRNRAVRWCEKSTEYEIDPRKAEKFIYELGLEGAKSIVTPGLRMNLEQVGNDRIC